MPFFRFTIHGAGDLSNGIAGFYTTRWSWARTKEAAELKVLRQVRVGLSPRWSDVVLRNLEIEEAWRINPLEIWRGPNRGYTFYSASD